ncbi:hypothetical protein B0H14DRAFT_2643529 [Mycena olivaceomarginata]|nr:hypothetical protein B0H14DRAFT_2643529 [Mycena olivaceomarginata]
MPVQALNASCDRDGEPLNPLPQPIARHAVSPVPAAPVAIEPSSCLYPRSCCSTPAHPNFPATKGALRRLNGVNLTVAIPVTQEAIDELRALIDTPREDALRWVSEDFAVVANDIYTVLGSPKLEVLSG